MDELWVNYLGENALIVVEASALLAYTLVFRSYLRERKQARLFADFENCLLNNRNADRFFSGEVMLSHEVAVIFPCDSADGLQTEKFLPPITELVQQAGLGDIKRQYSAGKFAGIDVHLHDYVRGIEVLRWVLLEHDAPKGTVIEFSCGDLLIHDNV